MKDLVFPVWKSVDGRCSCPKGADCESPGKHPVGHLAPHGFKDAKPLIEWGDLSAYSLGIPTGRISGLDVIDIDTAEAEEYWTSVAPTGYRVRTGGGGLHIYLKHSPGRVCGTRSFKGQFVAGTDFRSDGGYVVAAGASHVSGRVYEAIGAPDDIPDWAFEDHLPHGPKLTMGERNSGLTSVAGKLRARGAEFPQMLQELRRENMRCDPPLSRAELEGIARSVSRYPPRSRTPVDTGPVSPTLHRGGRKGPSVAQLLVEAAAEAELFHDDQREAYASVEVEGHLENYRVRSIQFRRWLVRRFRAMYGSVPGGQSLQAAALAIEAAAQYDWPLRPVFTRIGWEGETLWIDLGDAAWRAVAVTASGWEVMRRPPVRFVRGKAQAALPEPKQGGSLRDLLPFLNARDPNEEHFVLAVSWLIGAFHPRGPYPILYLLAERGSGKSSAVTWIRSLVDPSSVPLRSLSRDEQDLAVAARSAWVLGFDNVSTLPKGLSDALCRLSTGGGFGTRQLYTDDDETLFGGRRPLILNGIPLAASEPDLRDRVLLAHWPRLTVYRPDEEIAAEFVRRAPLLFGAVLDALVQALEAKCRGAGAVSTLPRMADFFSWVVWAEPKLPWRPGRFAEVFEAARATATQSSLAESFLGQTVVDFTAATRAWEGTATELLEALTTHAGLGLGSARRVPNEWPRNPRALSSSLRGLAPDLREVGVYVTFGKQGKARTRVIRLSDVEFENTRDFASAPAFASASVTADADGADAADANIPGPSSPKPTTRTSRLPLAAAVDINGTCSRFGLTQEDAFPGLRFHPVEGDPTKIVVVRRAEATEIGPPWGIGQVGPSRGAGGNAK